MRIGLPLGNLVSIQIVEDRPLSRNFNCEPNSLKIVILDHQKVFDG